MDEASDSQPEEMRGRGDDNDIDETVGCPKVTGGQAIEKQSFKL